MTSPERVRITHDFASDPATVFEKLAEHENLAPVFGATITPDLFAGLQIMESAARDALNGEVTWH